MTTLLQLRRPSRLTPSGFSLFEVLLVLAVIGVLLALAIPMINQNDAIYAARDRRNAQELASTSVMAQTAGLNFVEGEDVLETVRSIVRGGMPARGAMKGRIFVVPGLSEEDIRGAARFLAIQNGELRYTNSEVPQSPGDQRL
ncbi:MAG: prepilin-type N-terminal cleavage/methylation domain-containing protein [Prosthecobacter sp.]|jgi:prepilin-type N-terminal cleavage/methylation domain-containing protein|uniref:type II secretion system protein n=1 Tax=Prosthecobacter sp. TaxID=1965333 RepID=UPI0019EEEE61|nr:prepilin-type N-terminal cleavage/methylation domain-containing protein [Prosthecobacter sp.]MBE2287537.1 prepilin-type N-terminal cleavage/methylation domain-containing protein [Prosthecobacter sp.]